MPTMHGLEAGFRSAKCVSPGIAPHCGLADAMVAFRLHVGQFTREAVLGELAFPWRPSTVRAQRGPRVRSTADEFLQVSIGLGRQPMPRIAIHLLTISKEPFRPRHVWFERFHELCYCGGAKSLRDGASTWRAGFHRHNRRRRTCRRPATASGPVLDPPWPQRSPRRTS